MYNDLFEKDPYKAVPYFLYVIEKIIEVRQYESHYDICSDFAFYLYRPDPDKKERLMKVITSTILYFIA